MNDLVIRTVTAGDIPAISAIYNHYVRTSTATYQLEPDPFEAREAWFTAHAGRFPISNPARQCQGDVRTAQ